MIRSLSSYHAGLMAVVLSFGVASCAQYAAQHVPSEETPGITGNPPTPYAKPGQTLPMQPAREIAFRTDQGSMLSLDLSPDGETILFDMLGDIYTLPIDGGEATQIASGMALDAQPVWSPDGRTILFISDRSGAENLWLVDSHGRNLRQISFHDDNPVFVSPEWAPDGQSVMVTRFRVDLKTYELWRFRPVTGDMGRVLRSSRPEADDTGKVSSLGARFSPDGDDIYLASLSADPEFDDLSAWSIVRREAVTGEEDVVLPAGKEGATTVPRFRPAISPDGKSLVFGERRSGVTRLNVMTLADGVIRELAEIDPDAVLAALTNDAIPRYDFTRDGRHVLINRGGRIDKVPLDGGTAQPIPFQAEIRQGLGPLGRHQAAIEEGPVRARLIQAPEISPDGTRFAFSSLGHVHIQDLGRETGPGRLREGSITGYNPSWSPDGQRLAHVSWSHDEGGHVWLSSADGERHEQLTDEAAFYSHPVFTPDGHAIIAVRSEAEARRRTYMEYGQLRDADLVLIPIEGGEAQLLASGRIGGRPHFAGTPGEILVNTDRGVEAVSIADRTRRVVTQAVGPGWYFSDGPLPADDLRVSPDGNWALAQIAQQLHLYRIDPEHITDIDLSASEAGSIRLTDIGADYFGWSQDGRTVFWSVGSTLRTIDINDVGTGRGEAEAKARSIEVAVMAERDQPARQILLRGGNILTMADAENPGAILQGGDILVDGNRIARIAPAGAIVVADDVYTVDLGGAYVIPGLIDAHYHLADIRRDVLDLNVWGLRTNLAFGITTLFDPSSLTIDMLAYQDMIETGDITGSRLFTTGPAVFDYNDFRSKDQVRAVLSRYKNHYRVSNLKQYRVGNRRVRQWFAEVADEFGMTATTEGALSYRFGLTGILDGFAGIEHGIPPMAQYNDFTELFARSGTSSTLTLMITHGGLPADKVFIERSNALADRKYADFVPTWFRESRLRHVQMHPLCDYTFGNTAANALKMHRAGGTVGLGAHGDIPGLGTQWELQAYVDSGWAPEEALWAATMGNAVTISRDESLGSLAPGKLADLVILEQNPLADIRHTLGIRFVMKNGRLYDPETLSASTDTIGP